MIESIIVIGNGSFAIQCAEFLKSKFGDVTLVESRDDGVISSKNICYKKGLSYLHLIGEDLTSFLMNLTEDTLVVSAANRYIFPKKVVEKKNLLIINYHGALLPKYPGRNAEAWAIFEEDKFGGITWHIVDNKVDSGAVIIQRQIHINEDMTSLKLLKEYSKIALQCLKEIIDDVICKSYKLCSNVNDTVERKIYYSWMKPNDGIVDLNWPIHKISAFLRSMDYGAIETLGKPVLRYEGNEYIVNKYVIAKEGGNLSINLEPEAGWCKIIKEDGTVTLLINKIEK